MLVAVAFAALGAIVLVTYRRDLLAAMVGVIVVSAILLVPTFYVDSQAVKTGAVAVIVGTTGILVALRRLNPNRRRGSWLYVAYLGVVLATTLLHPAVAEVGTLLTPAIPSLALLLVVLIASVQERSTIVRFVIGLSVVEAVYAGLQMVGAAPRLWGNTVTYGHQLIAGFTRGEGTLGHPLMLALLLLIAIALTATGRGPRGGLRVATLLILLGGLFATGSRSGLVVAVLFLLFTMGGTVATRVLAGGLMGALLIAYLAATGFFTGDLVSNFLTGDSVGHRAGALDAVPRLLGQGFAEVLIGSGAGSTESLFMGGLLQAGTFYAIDNQFVSTLAAAGLIGLAVLVILILRALRVGSGSRLPLVAVVVFFFTFDVLAWPAGAALFTFALGLAFTAAPVSDVTRASGGTGKHSAGEPDAVRRR